MHPHLEGPKWLDIDLQPYAGRYVALVEGRIAAVADSPEGAFVRARHSRLRRMPVILQVVTESASSDKSRSLMNSHA